MNINSSPFKTIHGSILNDPISIHPIQASKVFNLAINLPLLLICLCAFDSRAQENSRAWNDDFAFLHVFIEEVFPRERLLKQVSRLSFVYDQIRQDHSEMEKPAAVLKLMAILGALDEKSSHLDPFQESVQFNKLPLTLNWFESELGVIESAESTLTPIGSRLIRIGQFSIEDIYTRFETILPGATEIERRTTFLTYVMIPELLLGLDIINSLDPVEITFVAQSGARGTRKLSPSNETRWKKGSNPMYQESFARSAREQRRAILDGGFPC